MCKQNHFSSLIELLQFRAESQSHHTCFTFLKNGTEASSSITFSELDRQARAIAADLQEITKIGDRACLMYPAGIDFITAFFGCLYAGVIAVPSSLPCKRQKSKRLARMIYDSEPTVILSTKDLSEDVQHACGTRCIATDQAIVHSEVEVRIPDINSDNLALLQYTSGSTSDPKGVMVSHGNLLYNLRYIQESFRLSPASVSVTWLPGFHDMGLIDGILQPVYSGFAGILMSPSAFVLNPLSWLRAISSHRATHSGAPNFAYDLCVRRSTPEQRSELDLSCWLTAYNGAEPVRAETLDQFSRAFTQSGFRPEFFYPCYGLAEATLMVAGDRVRGLPTRCKVNTDQLRRDLVHEPTLPEEKYTTLISVGRCRLQTQVKIVDPSSKRECSPNQVGEIWVSGPSVAKGYWNRPGESSNVFGLQLSGRESEMFLRSGDLGFLQNDELYITGRLKDLMIFAGRNYYPHDVELTIERIDPRFQLGSCAAFSVEIDGVEELIAIQEIPRRGRHDLDLETVAGKIRRAVAEEHELHIHAVVFLFRGQIPKTSSGKIKRHACQRAFLEGTFEEFGRSTLSGGNLAQDALMAPSSADLKSCSIGQRDTLVTDHLCSLLKSALRRQISEADLLRPLVQLGLDSINATLITHRIESDLGVELSAIDLLSGASTQELASKIANDLSFTSSPATQSKAPSQCSEASLEQRDPELLPLNAGQEALWYMHQLSPQSSSLNEMFAARVTSTLDVEVLQRSFQLLVDRHSALRTTITLSEGMPWQLVHEEQCVDFQVVNALEWTAEQVDAFIAKEGHKSFDLKTGPLFRVLVCSLADNNHVLLLSAHHIVVDFWSLLLILDELRTIYPVIRTGGNMRLPLIVGQLSNHAVQQHDFMATTAAQTKLTYWQSKLSGSQPILNLTADQPRPVVNNFRGSRSSFTWDGEFSKKVKSAAAQRCCTPYTFMLTAFFVLLHRYTGKLDITVGSSSTGRLSAEFAKSVGYFVNQVALRVQLSHNATFSSWLDEVWKSVLEAQANQEIPHSRLVAHLSPGRTSSSPLFNTMFVHEQCHQLPELAPLFSGIAGRGVYLGELRFESFAIERRASQFDLSLMVLDQPHGMSLTWEYNTELFSSNRVAQIHRHFENILRTAVDNVEQPVGCLAMLDDSELTKITSDWNKTHSPNSSDKCFHELFELQALSHPDVIALETGTESLTFRALNEQANQVARYLRTVGVGQNSLVAVCMKRSIEMMAALIGVLKTGAAYVPIDPNYPPERKAILIEDSHPHAVLSQRSVADSLPRIAPRVICLDVAVKEIGMHDKSDLRIPLRTDSLAYVIYTSGSTGRPKGVAVPHRGLMNYLNWCVDAYGASLGSGAAVSTSIGFDATITSLFSPLLVGRKVVLLPEERELFALYQALQEEFSLVKLTPSHLEILRSLLVAEQAKDAHGRFPTIRVRVMVIGGEALSAKSVAFWRNVAPATRLINEYGPTEAVVGCCFYEVPDELPSDGCVPIGRPITNAKVYILDTQFQPVPVGVQGELYIGGDGLADGYYNQPDLTAERFLRLPLCDNCLTRVYKTGDAACYLPDGTIEFLGRLDDQVQIRGFRIELGEVESALRRHPRIEEAAVVVTGETDDDQRLIAYIVCVTDENEVRPIELQHFLSPILPNQAVPTAFVTIDHLPLTSHGKVDRDALPAPQSEHFCKTQHRIQPQGNLEKLVAEAWKDVLNRDDVGVEDNFFDAGGHSLLAVRLSERLHSLCESISVIDILQHPTIRLLAKHLAGQKPSLGSISITSRANVQIEVIRRFQTKHRQRDGQN